MKISGIQFMEEFIPLLGISKKGLRSLTIKIELNEAVRAEAVYLVNIEDQEQTKEVIKRYYLSEVIEEQL